MPDHLGPAFNAADAAEIGLQRSRLRAKDLEAPFRSSRLVRPTATYLDDFARHRAEVINRCRAYQPVAAAGAVFSHSTAALLWGMPLPWRLERSTVIHVTVPTGTQPPRMRGVVGHRQTAPSRAERHGLPVVSPELAWVQLAQFLTVDELVVAGDHLLRRKRPLSQLALLQALVQSLHRTRGVVSLRLAIPDLREGTDSSKESETRLVLVRAGLPEPVIGHEVIHEGYFVGTPDLAYVKERIALDYEGEVHLTPRVFREDITRRELFQDADWHHIRVVQTHPDAPNTLVALVTRALARRASTQ